MTYFAMNEVSVGQQRVLCAWCVWCKSLSLSFLPAMRRVDISDG